MGFLHFACQFFVFCLSNNRNIKLNKKLTKSSLTDTDEDGIRDWEEVNVKLIDENLDRNPNLSSENRKKITTNHLPSLQDMLEIYNWKDYVSDVPYSLMEEHSYLDRTKIKVLPIYSNPADPDSDGDGIVDCIVYLSTDICKNDGRNYYVTEFDDPNPLKFEYLWQWPVVSEDAIEEYENAKGEKCYRSKVNKDGDKLVFNPKYKLKRLQTSPYENRSGSAHIGIDVATGNDSKTFYNIAAYDGEIYCINSTNRYSSAGLYVVLKHNINGEIIYSKYLHMEKILLKGKVGDPVYAGDVLGITGNTGISDGTHLHFDIATALKSDTDIRVKTPIDPILFNSSPSYKEKNDKLLFDFNNTLCDFLINIPNEIENTDSSTEGTENEIINSKYYDCILDYYKIDGVY